jgi:hypothetical protein
MKQKEGRLLLGENGSSESLTISEHCQISLNRFSGLDGSVWWYGSIIDCFVRKILVGFVVIYLLALLIVRHPDDNDGFLSSIPVRSTKQRTIRRTSRGSGYETVIIIWKIV